MTNPVFLGAGKVYPQAGLTVGKNRNGETISGHRTAPGQWQLTNQDNGTQLDVNVDFVGPKKHVGHVQVTRTDADGKETTNDITLLSGKGRGFVALDLNQSGFQPTEGIDVMA